jgi:hypothetical protein
MERTKPIRNTWNTKDTSKCGFPKIAAGGISFRVPVFEVLHVFQVFRPASCRIQIAFGEAKSIAVGAFQRSQREAN